MPKQTRHIPLLFNISLLSLSLSLGLGLSLSLGLSLLSLGLSLSLSLGLSLSLSRLRSCSLSRLRSCSRLRLRSCCCVPCCSHLLARAPALPLARRLGGGRTRTRAPALRRRGGRVSVAARPPSRCRRRGRARGRCRRHPCAAVGVGCTRGRAERTHAGVLTARRAFSRGTKTAGCRLQPGGSHQPSRPGWQRDAFIAKRARPVHIARRHAWAPRAATPFAAPLPKCAHSHGMAQRAQRGCNEGATASMAHAGRVPRGR